MIESTHVCVLRLGLDLNNDEYRLPTSIDIDLDDDDANDDRSRQPRPVADEASSKPRDPGSRLSTSIVIGTDEAGGIVEIPSKFPGLAPFSSSNANDGIVEIPSEPLGLGLFSYSRRRRVESVVVLLSITSSYVCMFIRSVSESTVLPSRETWFIDSWSPPRNVESIVVFHELGTNYYRVSILLLIRSRDAVLGTISDHSSLQVRL
jgi:hypothetical protein